MSPYYSEQTEAEYLAWQDVVAEWPMVIEDSISHPKFDSLIAAINRRAEYLTALRLDQYNRGHPDMVVRAFLERDQHYQAITKKARQKS